MAYKLTYFELPGTGEQIRLLFSYGNIEFEDVRIERKDWAALKPKTPFGQVPLLEHNGKVMNQSMAITRYVGKLVKLAGNNDWENLEIDAIADTIMDLRIKVYPIMLEKDEAKVAALKESLSKETVPFIFERLNKAATKEGLVLGRLTWVDVVFLCAVQFIKFAIASPDLLKDYPNLDAVYQKVLGVKSIKAFIDKHPRLNI